MRKLLDALPGRHRDPAGNPEHHLEAAGLHRRPAAPPPFLRAPRRPVARPIGPAPRRPAARCGAPGQTQAIKACYRIAHDPRPQLGRAAALRGADGGNRQRDVRPVFAGGLHDLGAADELERRLAVLAAGFEPRVIDRRPARAAHRIGDAKQRRRGGVGVEIDADLELLRRRGVALGLEPRDLAVDVALLDLGVADHVVGGGDLLGDGRERQPAIRRSGAPRPFRPARRARSRQSARRTCGARWPTRSRRRARCARRAAPRSACRSAAGSRPAAAAADALRPRR